MNEKSEIGKKAEQLVADFLRKKGYIIAKTNYHSRYGEIDVIAENQKYVCFVEVKMRGENAIFTPAEAVDRRKQQKIILRLNRIFPSCNRDLTLLRFTDIPMRTGRKNLSYII